MAPRNNASMKNFLEELSRRKVIKVAIAYLIGAWIVIQLAETIFPNIGLPETAVTLVIGLIIVGFPLALILSWVFDITPKGVVETQGSSGPSIAVLPFTDMSEDKNQEHFCDGLTEELLNVLTCIPDLRVASRTSSFSVKGKQFALKEVAEKFDVQHILEGSVRKAGNRIRVTAQLIEAGTDGHLWSETYDRELDDIFAIQDDISAHILEKLKLNFGPGRTSDSDTNNAKAYDFFLRGRGYMISKGVRDIELAAEMFQKAVDMDPGFVRAWVNLAETGAVYAVFYGEQDQWLQSAAAAGDRLMEIAPERAESFLACGFSRMAAGDFAGSESNFLKAVELDSTLDVAYHYLARSQQHQGKMQLAAENYVNATNCNPDDFESPSIGTTIFENLGDEINTQKYARISVERTERNLRDYPDNQRAYYLGSGSLTTLGEMERGREWIEKALALQPDDTATQYNAACFYAQIGEQDLALDLLKGSIVSLSWMQNDPDLDSLRDHPRYQAILDSLQNQA
jgi:adenylate cyclase